MKADKKYGCKMVKFWERKIKHFNQVKYIKDEVIDFGEGRWD
jgi:hypothetical protein